VIHHEVEGSGFPLVLHTGGAGDLRMWRLARPTLIVAVEEEEHVDAAVAALPNGESVILPGLGHTDGWARSDLVLPHARRFLAEALA
jgi:hypothetical protein